MNECTSGQYVSSIRPEIGNSDREVVGPIFATQ